MEILHVGLLRVPEFALLLELLDEFLIDKLAPSA
jgi:hypothetical protein